MNKLALVVFEQAEEYAVSVSDPSLTLQWQAPRSNKRGYSQQTAIVNPHSHVTLGEWRGGGRVGTEVEPGTTEVGSGGKVIMFNFSLFFFVINWQ